MLSWLLIPAAAAQDLLSVAVGLSTQASTVFEDTTLVLESGPQAHLAIQPGTFRHSVGLRYNTNAVPGWTPGEFTSAALSLSTQAMYDNGAGRPIAYAGGGLTMARYRAQITEYRFNGWQLDHDDLQSGLGIHATGSWRAVHQEAFAVELAYTLRRSFLSDTIIGPWHHLLEATVWLNVPGL